MSDDHLTRRRRKTNAVDFCSVVLLRKCFWIFPLLLLAQLSLVGFARDALASEGYAGGFGVGSDIMADLFGGVGYRFSELISATIGYRWMKVDRDSGGFLYDVEQEGVLAGLTFSF
jgi:hypothetical protein